jgi:hypothetical protein
MRGYVLNALGQTEGSVDAIIEHEKGLNDVLFGLPTLLRNKKYTKII